jgi:hypothetical protein
VQRSLTAAGIAYEVTPVDGVWDVVVPVGRVLPEELDGPLAC